MSLQLYSAPVSFRMIENVPSSAEKIEYSFFITPVTVCVSKTLPDLPFLASFDRW
jgi:hypothetical protein